MIELTACYPKNWQEALDLGAGFDLRLGHISFGASIFGLGFEFLFYWGDHD